MMPLLASCGTLSAIGDATTPLDVLMLEPPDDLPVRQGRPLQRDIIVEEPTASGALATERIMIRPGAFQAPYLPGVRWSDPAPVMVQTLMLRALDATGAFQYVGRRPLGPGGDFAIVTESAPAASLDDLALAVAFDEAAGRVISEFATWTLSTLGAI
jgi:cholesterol transport system auxiliary component